ncbi:MAG: acyl carrier protein [Pseudomonadota bacterium]
MSVSDTVKTIIAEQAMLEVSDITDESTLESLGLDSMGLVECIFAIEETFDIQVPFNANEPEKSDFDSSSIGKMIEAVERLIAERDA